MTPDDEILDGGGRDHLRSQSEPRQVTKVRNQEVFISDQRLNEAGELYWLASPIDQSDPEKELRVRIPRDAMDRAKIARVLSDQWQKAKLHLVRRDRSGYYDVLDAQPMLQDNQRQVHDENGHAFTWSAALDQKVEEYFHHAVQMRIHAVQSALIADKSQQGFAVMKEHASKIFCEQMAALGDQRTSDQLATFFQDGVPALDGARQTFPEALLGRQLDATGKEQRVYYDTVVALSDQVKLPEDPGARASAVANYSMQRAAFDYIHSSVCQKATPVGGEPISFLEKMEHDLVARRSLFGFHPTRTGRDYSDLTAEFSERLTMASVQASINAFGGTAANPDYDDVTPDGNGPRDNQGKPYTLHSYLYDKAVRLGMLQTYSDKDDPEKFFARYSAAMLELEQEHLGAKEKAVAGEMDKAMASGRNRLSDPTEAINKRLQQLMHVEKGVMTFFEELENPPDLFG